MGIEKFIEKVCVQTAVYWGSPVNDGYGGKTFGAAVEIDVRWEDKNELVTLNNGKEYMSKATILVTADVDLGGYLYLGTEDDLESDHSDPLAVDDAFEIKKFDKIPMIKKTDEFVRTCYL